MIVISCLIAILLLPHYDMDVPPPRNSTPPDPAPAETAEERSHRAILPIPPPCAPCFSQRYRLCCRAANQRSHYGNADDQVAAD
jgi:hypothetical protein